MLPKLKVKAEYSDRTLEASVGLADYIAFERHYGESFAKLFTEGRIEWVSYCAHRALIRSKQDVPEDFDAFLSSDVSIDWGFEDEDPKDLGAEAPLASSQISQEQLA